MKAFNSYCYQDMTSLSSAVASHPFVGDGSVLSSYSFTTSTVSLTYDHLGILTTYTYTPPDCLQTGFLNSYFGVSVSDSVSVSWLVATAMIFAWGIKTIKRAK